MVMLSRVAESIFWIARYVERAENTARLLDVSLRTSREWPSAEAEENLPGNVRVMLRAAGMLSEYERRVGALTEDGVIAFTIADLENPDSVRACIAAARANARSVREAISSEMWEELNRIHLALEPLTATFHLLDSVHEFCREVRIASQTFQGIATATLPRDEGWHFFQAGLYLERASMTARILDAHTQAHPLPDHEERPSPEEVHRWLAVLRSVSAYEAFTRTVGGGVRPLAVAEFLLANDVFPRAVAFGLHRLRDELSAIDRGLSGTAQLSPYARAAVLAARFEGGAQRRLRPAELRDTLLFTEAGCNAIGDVVREAYFENFAAALLAS
jgi:uncharacterized alpha-E superfamily protein